MAAYLLGTDLPSDLPLELQGRSAFARKVYNLLRQLPRGRVVSYGELAKAAGKPNAGRAAGSFMASNQFPLVIPCHRVVRSDGCLGGFSSSRGIADKIALLSFEGVEVLDGRVPPKFFFRFG